MACQIHNRNIAPTLDAARQWISLCLIEDGSLFSESLWTSTLIDEVHHAFVENPDLRPDDFITRLKRQMTGASPQAQQLLAEMIWALLLFPANVAAGTKRRQIMELWALSGNKLSEDLPLLGDELLTGIGSGGPGFNNYRAKELKFLIVTVRDLKKKDKAERKTIFSDYDAFIAWIESVPQQGRRQFRRGGRRGGGRGGRSRRNRGRRRSRGTSIISSAGEAC